MSLHRLGHNHQFFTGDCTRAGLKTHLHKHSGLESFTGIVHFDPNPGCSRLLVELRIDICHTRRTLHRLRRLRHVLRLEFRHECCRPVTSGTFAMIQTVERFPIVNKGLPASTPAPAFTNRSMTAPETGARKATSEVSLLWSCLSPSAHRSTE